MAAINIGRQIVSSRKDEPVVGTPTGNSVFHVPPRANDEIYRDLSTFTFGAARLTAPSPSPSYDADVECDNMISPLTPIPPRINFDRTPRPSVVAVAQAHSSHPPQSQGHERILPLPPPPARRPFRDADYKFSATRFEKECQSSDPHDSDDVDTRSKFTRDREITRAHTWGLNQSRDLPISDTASQHTFGGRGINSSSVSVSSVTHSRTSSRLDFSSDDEGGYMDRSDHGFDEAQHTFSRNGVADFVDEDEEIDVGLGHAISRENLYGRRGSLPMPIPGSSSTDFGADGRESNLASLRRPSRSLDDTSVSGLGSSGLTPRSEPLSKGDWITLEAHAHAQQQSEKEGQDPLAGLNLGYILGGQDISGYRRSSDALSYVQPRRKSSQGSQAFSFTLGWNSLAGRRSSTATTKSGPDDTFLRHLNKCNEGYGVQTGTWTFKREKADGSSRNVPWSGLALNSGLASPRGSFSESHRQMLEGRGKTKEKPTHVNTGMTPGTQEIWKCEVVGRFKVDRQTYRPDPTKAPHQRVNVRHILDPYSRGNTRGGPSVTIHKHSRAIAFSIYRAHNLTNRHRLRPGILLAPKKVQERFTSTKTTAKLATYGLLEERESGQNANTPSRTSSLGRKDRPKSADEAKAKSKLRSDQGNENQTGHVAKDSIRLYDFSTPPKDAPVSDVTNTETRTFSDGITVTEEHQTVTANDSYSRIESSSDQSTIKSLYPYNRHRDSLDVDPLPSRTPHAETYGTLDSSIIEYVRARPDRPADPDSNTSFFKRFLRPLPRSTLQASSQMAGLTSAQLEGNYKPPWLAMAPRAKQEETDRVIHNLNNSFKGVGLLPANAKPTSKTKKPPRPKNRVRIDILEHVPEDSLYMLLPLWPGETDPLSSPGTRPDSSPIPTLEDRHYLLVYYVPRLEKSKADQEQRKRSRSSQTSSSESASLPDDRSIILSEFHVCARLVSYNELRGSGVRLPSDGLSVTGAMWEAMQSIPNPTILHGRQSDWVIALYHGRERGIELMPDGLMKLGLCLPVPPPLPPVYPLGEEEMEETQEPLLSPMGRAAVEMAWAGCIALSSFGPT